MSVIRGMQIYTRVDVGGCNINIKSMFIDKTRQISAVFNEGMLFFLVLLTRLVA